MRKIFFLLFCLFSGSFANAQGIQFTDPLFKAKLLEANSSNQIAKDMSGNYTKIDLNGDGEISYQEKENITELKLQNSLAANVNEIFEFSNLKKLTINNFPNLKKIFINSFFWGNPFAYLEYLDLSNNSLTDIKLSESISNSSTTLGKLKYINCSNNQLTSYNFKINLDLIEEFNGSNNKVAGTYYKSSKTIKKIDISNNLFDTIRINCPSLYQFIFNNNPLKSVGFDENAIDKMEFVGIPTLESLTLVYSSEFSDLKIDNLPMLNFLSIRNIYYKSIFYMPNGVDYSNLNITIDMPEATVIVDSKYTQSELNLNYGIMTLISVKEFIVIDNPKITKIDLTDLRTKYLKLTNLQELTDLKFVTQIADNDNSINNSLTLTKLPRLSKIYCSSSNRINSEEYNHSRFSIADLPSLEELDISFISTSDFFLNNLPNLKSLKLYGVGNLNNSNLLIQNFPSLNSIVCSNSNFTSISFENLENLTTFEINNHGLDSLKLKSLPRLNTAKLSDMYQGRVISNLEFIDLPSLISIDLDRVALENLRLINLPSLKQFKYTNSYINKFSELGIEPVFDKFIFDKLPLLEEINITGGYFNDFDINTIENLKKIDLKESYFENILTFNSKSLNDIFVDYLTAKQIKFMDLPQIKNINLINDFGHEQIYLNNLKSLEKFYIQGNGSFYGKDDNGFSGLSFNDYPNLNEVIIDYNISNLEIVNLPSLTYLKCKSYYLENVKIDNSANLIEVDLYSGGQVDVITKIEFGDLKSLKKVKIVHGVSNLKGLDFSGCPSLEDLNCMDTSDYNELYFENINLKNGTNNLIFFNSGPAKSICVDSQEEIENLKRLNPNLDKTVFTDYCSFKPGGTYSTISGIVTYSYLDNNCDQKILDGNNVKIYVKDNDAESYAIPKSNGEYKHYLTTTNDKILVRPIIENPIFEIIPAESMLSMDSLGLIKNANFCIKPKGIHNDLEINVTPIDVARPGFDSSYKIIYKNKGNQTQSGKVALSFNEDLLDYVSSNPAFTTTDPWKLIWDFKDLKPFETRTIDVTFNANSPMEKPAVNNGDVLKFTTNIQTTVTDETPNDNVFDYKQTVVGSYDPNDKTCLQGTVITPEMIGDYVHYKIRFENTGDYFAQNVVVEDDIDVTKFDLSSLVVLNSSHNMETRIENNQAKFIFENIKLPAKESPDRHGYVVFKIKTLPTLKLNDSFSNAAKIYFDFNFPIETIPATTTIKEATNLSNLDFDFSDKISLYPVPTKDVLNISASNTIRLSSVEIYNTMGQVVQAITNARDLKSIDVQSLPKGTYFIKVNTNQGSSATTFIKE